MFTNFELFLILSLILALFLIIIRRRLKEIWILSKTKPCPSAPQEILDYFEKTTHEHKETVDKLQEYLTLCGEEDFIGPRLPKREKDQEFYEHFTEPEPDPNAIHLSRFEFKISQFIAFLRYGSDKKIQADIDKLDQEYAERKEANNN